MAGGRRSGCATPLRWRNEACGCARPLEWLDTRCGLDPGRANTFNPRRPVWPLGSRTGRAGRAAKLPPQCIRLCSLSA